MKRLRNFAAQSEYKKRVTQVGLGGAVLFCLSFGISQNAIADDTALPPTPEIVPPTTVDSSIQSGEQTTTTTTSPTLTSVADTINSADATLTTAVNNSTATLQAIPDVVNKVAELPAAQQAIADATVAINAANVAIDIAKTDLTTAKNAADLILIAQSGVNTATAQVDTAQQVLSTAQSDLTPIQDAVASACTNFYIENGNLGTATSNVTIAQQAADAAVVANQAAESALNTQTPITIAAQETNAVARDANDAAQAILVTATQAVTDQQDVVATDTQAVLDAQAAATASASPGLNVTVYSDPQYGAQPPVGAGTIVRTTTTSNINYQWGSGSVMGGPSDRVQVKFEGAITSDTTGNIQFYAPADDGTKLYVDNTLVINDWRDKGGGGSQSAPIAFTANVPKPITLWFYENGGGASVVLYWYKAGSSGYTVVPASAFNRGTVDPTLAAAVTAAQGTLQVDQATLDTLIAAQTDAQTSADNALAAYISANQAMGAAEAIQAPIQQAAWDTRAAVETTQANVVDAQSAYDAQLTVRDAAYSAWQDAINAVTAQQSVIDETQIALDTATAQFDTATSVLQIVQATAASTLSVANTSANSAVQTSQNAATVIVASTQTIQKAIADKAAADAAAKAAADKAAADARAAAEAADAAAQVPPPAPQPEPVPDVVVPELEPPVVNPVPDPEPPVVNPVPDPEPPIAIPDPPDAVGEPDVPVDPTPVPVDPPVDPAPEPAPAPEPPIVVDENTTAENWVPAVDPTTYLAPEEIKAYEEIGLIPNSPDQLPDDVPKLPPAELLVPKIQIDVPGVENGGIQFFGTKTAPQVVGEDGKLTPPAPPPGSGLPIPPDAITTSDTFIGQPGGTTFNAPDVSVPVPLVPLEGAIAVVPGAEAVNKAFNAMQNIGNDMSPITRKKAKKILVLTVVIAAVRRRFN